MKIQIKNRWSGSAVFETDAKSLGGAILAAITAKMDLSGADLRGADLRDADLRDAVLRDAVLRDADLRDADLSGAVLSGADLSGAVLRDADLSGADLSGAVLRDADPSGADLSGADLSGADLRGADLSGAVLRDADLSGADLSGAVLESLLSQRTIVAEGDIIGWKKLSNGTICKLRIPAAAKRIGGLVGRKCRAEYVDVIEGNGASSHDGTTRYAPGETVTPDSYDPNPLVECSNGIHFFITRDEAERY